MLYAVKHTTTISSVVRYRDKAEEYVAHIKSQSARQLGETIHHILDYDEDYRDGEIIYELRIQAFKQTDWVEFKKKLMNATGFSLSVRALLEELEKIGEEKIPEQPTFKL